MATATATKEKKVVKKATPKTAPKALPKAVKANDGSFAIVETGGKQYQAIVGGTIKIEIMKGEFKVGDKLTFDKVLLTDSGAKTVIGTPFITGAKVTGTIKEIGRNKKVTVIHYKQKSRYFKKAGHRQPFFKVIIDSIS